MLGPLLIGKAISASAGLLLFAIPFPRRRFYEMSRALHAVLAVALVVALWIHLPPVGLAHPSRAFLALVASLWGFTHLSRLGCVLVQNFRFRSGQTCARIRYNLGAVQVDVTPPGNCTFRAGDIVYLTISRARNSAVLQAHPFAVAWWDQDPDGRDVASLLIEPQRGFTRDLALLASSPGDSLAIRALIEGPYGRDLNLGSYGTVMLFATGFGISSQIPIAKQLIQGYKDRQVKAQRVMLFWEVDTKCPGPSSSWR